MLAIPVNRFHRADVTYLTDPEVDALIAAPDRATWTGRRDHTLLLLAVQLRDPAFAQLRRQAVKRWPLRGD